MPESYRVNFTMWSQFILCVTERTKRTNEVGTVWSGTLQHLPQCRRRSRPAHQSGEHEQA
ncbi:MAG: hypothetical protein AMXMBFR13_44040 [Phycisphaerae bacterium]